MHEKRAGVLFIFRRNGPIRMGAPKCMAAEVRDIRPQIMFLWVMLRPFSIIRTELTILEGKRSQAQRLRLETSRNTFPLK
jgi:hypothetical protein